MKARAPYRFHSRAALGSAASGPRWWRRSYLPGPTWPRWGGLRGRDQGEGGTESATHSRVPTWSPWSGPESQGVSHQVGEEESPSLPPRQSTCVDGEPGPSDNLSSVATTKFPFRGRQKARPRRQASTSKKQAMG